MLFTNNDISQIIDCHSLIQDETERNLLSLVYDSRRVFDGPSSLFFALKSKRNDGHNYIDKAYQRGIREFIISNKKINPSQFPKANFYICSDTLLALQAFGKYIRLKRHCKVVAITGSNGKTICKEWLYSFLGQESYRSPLSYNSQIGVPISLSMIPQSCQTAIIEAGISETGEMPKHSDMIRPNDLIITNIGQAHDGGFENMHEKLVAKCRLAEHAERVFYHSDNTELDQYLKNNYSNKSLISWGDQTTDHLNINHSTTHGVSVSIKGYEHKINFNFTDAISLENLGHVLNYVLYDTNRIESYLEKCGDLDSVEMRLQLLNGMNGCKIINDCYNADIYSLARAISYLNQQGEDKKKTMVLAPLEGTGMDDKHIISSISNVLKGSQVDRIILFDRKLENLVGMLDPKIRTRIVDNIQQLKDQYFENEVILVKGARKYQLEGFVEHIETKAQTTALEINLSALENNFDYFKSKLESNTKIMAIIKASGYGSGSHVIAKTLENRQVDFLAVALIDEGIYLRNQGISTPIVVLNPDRYNLRKLFQYNLQPEIYNLDLLDELIELSEKFQSFCGIHINIDTGMNRLGFKEDELQSLLKTLSRAQYLKVISVFTHLSSSEDPKHDDLSKGQFEQYLASIVEFEKSINSPFLKHVLNTSGILRHPGFQLDMVRTGLGLYGLELSDSEPSNLQKVHSLKSFILQTKDIKAGESIGYNASFTATKNMRVGTLNIGYADGLQRNLSNTKWSVKLYGKLAPIIGKISMDLTTIDISHIPEAKVGDAVIIFDALLTLESLSKAADTIPYEILTGISERVKRIYYKE